MIVYPGNPPVRIKFSKSKTSYISKISLGSHTGTHVDAPRHVFKNGYGVDRIPLGKLVGPCRVLDARNEKLEIGAEAFRRANIKKGERILVKTRNSSRRYKKFYDDYVSLGSDAAKYLAQKGIALFGIDCLSVKRRGSADNRPHTELLRRGIPIFEGLDLLNVNPGRYFFIGLPLKFVGLDGAPARAVLITTR